MSDFHESGRNFDGDVDVDGELSSGSISTGFLGIGPDTAGWEFVNKFTFGPTPSTSYQIPNKYNEILVRIDNLRQNSGTGETQGLRFNNNSNAVYQVNDRNSTDDHYKLKTSKNGSKQNVIVRLYVDAGGFGRAFGKTVFSPTKIGDDDVLFNDGDINSIQVVNINGGEVAGTMRVLGRTQ